MPQGDKPYQNLSIRAIHVSGTPILKFKSIISNFTDIWSQKWSSTDVYGRMDPVSFYGGTQREMTLAFDVISDDNGEAAENMRATQKLIQYQYPRYGRTAGGQRTIIAPPYFSFSFLNLLSSTANSRTLYGYIKGSIQIVAPFGDKSKPLGYDDITNPNLIYFLNFNISMRIQVLHVGDLVGWSSPFSLGENYPYGVSTNDVNKSKGKVKEAAKSRKKAKTPVKSDAELLKLNGFGALEKQDNSTDAATTAAVDAANIQRSKDASYNSKRGDVGTDILKGTA